MTDRFDLRLTALERRLERAAPPLASPNLRRRVLSSVADVLDEKPPATASGWRAGSTSTRFEDVAAGALVPTAVAAVVAGLALSVASVFVPATRVSLHERARIAGVGSEMVDALAVESRGQGPTVRPSPAAGIPVSRGTLRAVDTRRILGETL